MNKPAYFIVGYALILEILAQESNQSIRTGLLECKLIEKDYRTLLCNSENSSNNYMVFPPYDGSYYNRIEIVIKSNMQTILFNQTDHFKGYESVLQSLSIQLSVIGPYFENHISNELEGKMDKLRDELFNLDYLQELSITNANFNSKDHMWKLPTSLQYLTLTAGNKIQYNEYNLSNLRYLKSVNFRNNKLNKLPVFHYPLYSLKELNLINNPLNEVTTNDIAKLCMLRKLSLSGTSFRHSDRYCECTRMQMFIYNLTEWMTTEDTAGFELDESLSCENYNNINCTNEQLDLNEAFNEREICLGGKPRKTVSRR